MTIPKELYQNIRRIQMRTKRTVNDVMAGMYQSAFKGQGMEFEEVREYVPGDEIRNIDWNVTARMQTPFVKSFREERELTLSLVIDVSESSLYGSAEKPKNQLIAEIGATLAFSAIENNDKVSLLLFSDQIEKYIPPKKGTRHVLRVIREILGFQPKKKGTNIAEALRYLGRVQKRKGICFLLSDFIDEGFTKELTLTAKKQDLIGIRISDPFEEVFPDVGLATLHDLETDEERLVDTSDPQVRNQLKAHYWELSERVQTQLQRAGAGYIDIPTNSSSAEKLRHYLLVRERHQK
jgi:uncharacterized protein (DUF58 family)